MFKDSALITLLYVNYTLVTNCNNKLLRFCETKVNVLRIIVIFGELKMKFYRNMKNTEFKLR